MKHLYIPFLCMAFMLTLNTAINAQISQGGVPLSYINKDLPSTMDLIEIPAPDMQTIANEDALELSKGGKYRIAVIHEISISPDNFGVWDILPSGDRIWRLTIEAPGAKATSLYFDQFNLPQGAELFVYTNNQLIGAFTEFNNDPSGIMATEVIYGPYCTIELNLPATAPEAELHINGIGYYYRGIAEMTGDKSGSCEVNVACSEGNSYQNQKRGVVKLQMKIGAATYLCTGSLVNTASNDCTPYLLTADHCGDGASTSDLNSWIFYFLYQASSCSGTTSSTTKTMQGCTVKAHDDYGSTSSGSDFYLVRLNQTVPSTHTPYFNGWTRSTTASTTGVGIHHPDGDIKKISTYSSALVNYGTHWGTTWVTTANGHGVTEGGSSGSPLFNSSGLIVGTLTGGYSACTVDGAGSGTGPDEEDYYGKFSYHWSSNGTTTAEQLKPWLDPSNTGATSVTGINFCTTDIEEIDLLQNKIVVFPNPANDQISVDFSDYNIENGSFYVTDILGNVVINAQEGNFNGIVTIDIHNLSNGLYILVLNTHLGRVAKSFNVIN